MAPYLQTCSRSADPAFSTRATPAPRAMRRSVIGTSVEDRLGEARSSARDQHHGEAGLLIAQLEDAIDELDQQVEESRHRRVDVGGRSATCAKVLNVRSRVSFLEPSRPDAGYNIHRPGPLYACTEACTSTDAQSRASCENEGTVDRSARAEVAALKVWTSVLSPYRCDSRNCDVVAQGMLKRSLVSGPKQGSLCTLCSSHDTRFFYQQ